MRIFVGDGAVEIAERGGAETEFGELDATVAEPVPMPDLHRQFLPNATLILAGLKTVGRLKAIVFNRVSIVQ
jgi:hypothetical protein